jgi:hypothetical protein
MLRLVARLLNNPQIDGDIYAMAMIRNSKILTLEEYYRQYPSKRPGDTKPFTPPKVNRTQFSRQNALEGMIKGLKGYIASDQHKGTERTRKLFAMMESRLKAVMQGKAVPDMTPGQML